MTVQELYEGVGGNYESAKRILSMDKLIARFIVKFLDDNSFNTLVTAWEGRDDKAAFEGAHAMKGVCANLGLDALSAQAGEICEQFRPGAARTMDDATLGARIDALRADYEKTVALVRAFAAEQ